MKILIIGLGSMGKRRISLLTKYFDHKLEIIGVDTREDRRLEVEKLFKIETSSDLDKVIKEKRPSCAFICTSPLTHSELIIKVLESNLNVFTEINLLADRYEEIIKLADRKNLKLFLSSTFMYRKEIQYIQDIIINATNKHHYRYHVGQYLPDWHPWEHYKDFFVGNKRTNGCRELLTIELPWIINTFGKIRKFSVTRDNISSLNVDYPDSYIITLEHESGHKGVLSVDIVSRKPIRSLEIYSEELHLFWDGTPDSLKRYDIKTKQIINIDTYSKYTRDVRYAENIIEDAYLEEIETFISMIENKEHLVRYTFEDDLYTLDIIDKIEGVI